jgi:hypothetical protein
MFNRATRDGLTQVVSFQMGRSEPPGTTFIRWLRENLYGKFTVNVGVYVPEVARHGGGEARSFVPEYYCCVRARLGELAGEAVDRWWDLDGDPSLALEIERRLEKDALPFLDRFATREAVLGELTGNRQKQFASPPRIVGAIILAEKGMRDEARRLLAAQVRDSENHPQHAEYVRGLAQKLGLGCVDA